jgi:hypothetical protein
MEHRREIVQVLGEDIGFHLPARVESHLVEYQHLLHDLFFDGVHDILVE